MAMQPLNFPLEGCIVGAAPDRPGATIQNCDLVSPRFASFWERSAQANSHETLQIGPKRLIKCVAFSKITFTYEGTKQARYLIYSVV